MTHQLKDIKHRNALKRFFLTFPQTTEIRQEFVNKIESNHATDRFMCSQETHENGGKHLHLAIEFTDKISKSMLLKSLKLLYPNDYKRIDVQAMSSWDCSILYLSKEDEEPYVKNCTSVDEKQLKRHERFYESRHWNSDWRDSCQCPKCKEVVLKLIASDDKLGFYHEEYDWARPENERLYNNPFYLD